MGSSAEGVLAHFQPRICQTGRGHPHPKVTNATLGSDLKHRPAAGPPSSRAKPRDSQEEEKGPNPCLSYSTRCPRCPLAPRELRGTAATPQGKGMRIHHPSLGTEQRQAALPAQAPPRRDPREIANPDRGRPARGDRDCSVTAPGTEPEPPLRTPTPARHRGQLPSAFREGKNPTSQTFPTPCAAGIPLTHSITWRGKKNKRKQEKGGKKKKGKPSSPCSSRGR